MTFPESIPFEQGNAPMPKGRICSPMDYAALGHMTSCPCYKSKQQSVIATPGFRDHAGLPGGTYDYDPVTKEVTVQNESWEIP